MSLAAWVRRLWSLPAVLDELGRIERLLAMEQLARALAAPELADPRRLERHGFRGMSQYDADGVLREIFRRVGAPHRTFVEFGAGTGLENNTAWLLAQGWRGVWIEGDRGLHARQRRHFGHALAAGSLRCVQAFLTRENINDVIANRGGLAGPIDLLSVDVDGNDYHLWDALDVVEPRVVVIEYNAYVPPPVRWVMGYDPAHRWDRSTYFGASLASLEALGQRKDYRLVGCDIVGLNAYFVRSSLCAEHFVTASPEALWHPRRWWLDKAFPTGHIPFGRPFEVR